MPSIMVVVAQLTTHTPQQLQELCHQCWARDPADRPSAAAAYRALRGWQLRLLTHLDGDSAQAALPSLWHGKKHTWSILGRAPEHQQGFGPGDMEALWNQGAINESSLVVRLVGLHFPHQGFKAS